MFAAAIIAFALVVTSPAHAVTGEYNPGALGGTQTAPPLDAGGAPTTVAPTTPVTPGTVPGTVSDGESKKKKRKKAEKEKERELPELGPAKPPTIAAPVSAVTRGTTPGLVPLAAVLAGLLLAAVAGRRLLRKSAA